MKALVVYDSVYGNTEKIAKAIGSALAADARVLRAGEVGLSDIESIDLLVVGFERIVAGLPPGIALSSISRFLRHQTDPRVFSIV